MKPIIVKESNQGKIEEIIKEIEGRATVRCISFRRIENAIKLIEDCLDIPKKHMIGIKAHVDPDAEPFPNKYKYIPYSTQFDLEYTGSGWKITDISRDPCHQSYKRRIQLELPPDAEKAILDKMRTIDLSIKG